MQERLCTWVKEQKLIAKHKVFLLPNVVSKPNVQQAVPFKEKKIVMVANFRRIKNQLLALEILNNLERDFELHLYGMVDEEDYYEEILSYIDLQKLSGRVTIRTGVTDLYQYLPQYRFALHTATNETGPLVLLEYMNCGLPFFTYNTGEVVNNTRALLPELVMDTLEVNDWVDRINTVIRKDERHVLQRKMEQIIERKYSEESYWSSLNAIYTNTLSKLN